MPMVINSNYIRNQSINTLKSESAGEIFVPYCEIQSYQSLNSTFKPKN